MHILHILSIAVLCMLAGSASASSFADASDADLIQLAKNHYINMYVELDAIPAKLNGTRGITRLIQSAGMLSSIAARYLTPTYVETEDSFLYNEHIPFTYTVQLWVALSARITTFAGIDRQYHHTTADHAKIMTGCDRCVGLGGRVRYDYSIASIPVLDTTTFQPTYDCDGNAVFTDAVKGYSLEDRRAVVVFKCANPAYATLDACPMEDVITRTAYTYTSNINFIRTNINGVPTHVTYYERFADPHADGVVDILGTVYSPPSPSALPSFPPAPPCPTNDGLSPIAIAHARNPKNLAKLAEVSQSDVVQSALAAVGL